jgi:hypothetical protein
MMDKRVTFEPGDGLTGSLIERVDVTRVGGGFDKLAGATHPEVARFLRDLRPDPRRQYVLIAPMGSWEVWGNNKNGDLFPELALSFDKTRDDPTARALELEARFLVPFGKRLPPGNYTNFGFRTFLDALRYREHANKDPSRSYGDIVLAVWNPMLRRVEVITRHDREAAKRVGAEQIITDIDEGRPRKVSMGCRVPFDVCSVCGNIARTTAHYCEHLRTRMGSVMDDGTVVGAYNLFPRFFDLSDVLVPAAPESAVLKKVASVKSAASEKKAEIDKRVEQNTPSPIRKLESVEPDIPLPLLRSPTRDLASTLALLGIVLRPHEYQYSWLSSNGHEAAARQLYGRRQHFPLAPLPDPPAGAVHLQHFRPGIAARFAGVLPFRSAFAPHLGARITAVRLRSAPPAEHTPSNHPRLKALFARLAADYAAYRASMRAVLQELPTACQRYPVFYREHFVDPLHRAVAMGKVAALEDEEQTLSVSLPARYLFSAYRDESVAIPEDWAVDMPDGPAGELLRVHSPRNSG